MQKGRLRNRWRDKGEEDLNTTGIKKEAGDGLRSSGMAEDLTGSQGAQET